MLIDFALRKSALIQHRQCVRIEIVHYEDDLVGIRVGHIGHLPQHHGPIRVGTLVGALHMPLTGQRFAPHEQVRGAAAFVLIVLTGRMPRLHGPRRRHVGDQRLARLVETDDRALGIIGPRIHLQHVFHRADEASIALLR
jgi:hypothetical protein